MVSGEHQLMRSLVRGLELLLPTAAVPLAAYLWLTEVLWIGPSNYVQQIDLAEPPSDWGKAEHVYQHLSNLQSYSPWDARLARAKGVIMITLSRFSGNTTEERFAYLLQGMKDLTSARLINGRDGKSDAYLALAHLLNGSSAALVEYHLHAAVRKRPIDSSVQRLVVLVGLYRWDELSEGLRGSLQREFEFALRLDAKWVINTAIQAERERLLIPFTKPGSWRRYHLEKGRLFDHS